MSILWIDDVLFHQTEDGKKEYSNCSLFIYANILSVLFVITIAYFYKANPQLRKAPNNLTILLIIIEGLISFHLLIIFTAVNVNSDDIETLNFFLKLTVTFSPVLIFAAYYLNACIAHNIYITYYDYRKSYQKRILFYKYSVIFLSVVVYIFTIYFLDFNKVIHSFMPYKNKFINIFYTCGIIIIGYIIHRMYFITVKENEFITLNTDDPRDTAIQSMVTSLVKRHTVLLLFFLIAYMPNNILIAVQHMSNFISEWEKQDKNEITNHKNISSPVIIFISTLLISLKPFFSVMLHLTDPYLRKFIFNYFGLSKSGEEEEEEVHNLADLKKMVGGSSSKYFQTMYEPPKLVEMNDLGNSNLEVQSNDTPIVVINNVNMNGNGHVNPNMTMTPSNFYDKRSEEYSDIGSVHSLNSNFQLDNTVSGFVDSPTHNYHNNNNNIPLSNKMFCKTFRQNTNTNAASKKHSSFYLNEGHRTFDLMNSHLESTDNIYRMIAISISINQDRIFDKENIYKVKFESSLPWPEVRLYNDKSSFSEYKQDNLPDWVSIKYDKRFRFLKIRIKKFAALVFHHIRLIDGITIDDCIKSLDPILNLEKVTEVKVSGGRSPNSIQYTWDKKMLIKTISKHEKKLLMKDMLTKYHVRMRDTKTLLCRIYGVFRIQIGDQYDSYVVLMKNMCDLPLDTRTLTFDLKGSTVDRKCISKEDKKSCSENYRTKEELISGYKDVVLKDNDLSFLDIKFNLSSSDATNLMKAVEQDSLFLEKYWITDYSLLLTIHKFRVEDYRANFKNLRVMKSYDDKYLFCFAIIDFLTTYDLEKKSEKITKNFTSLVKRAKDKNFSVQDPVKYGFRFRNFIKSLICIQDDH